MLIEPLLRAHCLHLAVDYAPMGRFVQPYAEFLTLFWKNKETWPLKGEQLYSSHMILSTCTAISTLQQLHCNNWTAISILQKLYCNFFLHILLGTNKTGRSAPNTHVPWRALSYFFYYKLLHSFSTLTQSMYLLNPKELRRMYDKGTLTNSPSCVRL